MFAVRDQPVAFHLPDSPSLPDLVTSVAQVEVNCFAECRPQRDQIQLRHPSWMRTKVHANPHKDWPGETYPTCLYYYAMSQKLEVVSAYTFWFPLTIIV